MPHTTSQAFLRELDKKLWTAADRLPVGTEILAERGSSVRSSKITSTGKLIEDALEAGEKENPNGAERHGRPSYVARRVRAGARINRKNVLNKNYTQQKGAQASSPVSFQANSQDGCSPFLHPRPARGPGNFESRIANVELKCHE